VSLIDFSTLMEWFILAIVSIVGAYALGELANLLVTTRAINAIQNTSSSAINALVSVHNTSVIAKSSSDSQNNASGSYAIKVEGVGQDAEKKT
jgi:uncharacterized membrane-anchored protein YitT (DUF2179 family)